MSYYPTGIIFVIAFGASLIGPARASDAEFQRALNDAKCAPAQVATLRDEKDIKEYLVTCLGSPPRKVGITCARSKCSASSTEDEPDSQRIVR